MKIDLNSADLNEAVIEYLQRRVQLPEGKRFDVPDYMSSITVYVEAIPEPEPAADDVAAITDGTAD